MARKALIERNKKRKRLILENRLIRKELKEKIKNPTIVGAAKMDLVCQLDSLSRDSSPVRYRNRCFVTGRARGFWRMYGVSRHAFREMAAATEIPGLIKASW